MKLRTMTKEEIQAVRLAMGLSVAEFAARCNVDRTTIYRYEDGRRAVTGAMVALMDYFGAAAPEPRRTRRAGRHASPTCPEA